jgi:hypothetical protein
MDDKTKKECLEMLKMKGEIRGVVLKTDINYVLQREGEEGVKKIESGFRELGFPVNYEEIRAVNWYPLGWAMVFGFLAIRFFNWPESDMVEIGKQAPKFSFMIRTLAKYLVSPKVGFEAAAKFWTKQISIGTARTIEFDEKKQRAVLRVEGFKGHWIICAYVRGYLETVTTFTLKNMQATIRETKCALKGAEYHEFEITWK